MSRKNFKVETTENGQATLKKIDKTPTGKVKKIVDAEKRRKEREEQYKNRRVNSLMRRCARMKLSEEDTKKYVEKLLIQLDAPKKYAIHVLFRTGQKDKKAMNNLAREAILNAKIECKILTDYWAYIIGDEKILAKLREILPTLATIHPYAMKAEPILPQNNNEGDKKPSNNSKTKAAEAKAARKGTKFTKRDTVRRSKTLQFSAKRKTLAERKKTRKATIVQAVHKKPSESLKIGKKHTHKMAALKGGYYGTS